MKKIVFILLGLLLSACNLSTAPPTPTAAPLPPQLPLPTLPPQVIETPIIIDPQTTTATINPNCPLTPIGWVAYTVVAGDTLGVLAEQTASTIEEIQQGNCLEAADSIFVEQVLYLPRPPITQ